MTRGSRRPVITLPPEQCYVMKLIELVHEPVLVTKPVYMCRACRQVWALKWHADSCDVRNHESTVDQEYLTRSTDIPHVVTYTALRVEPERIVHPVPAPESRHQHHRTYKLTAEDVLIMQRSPDGYQLVSVTKTIYECAACHLVWPLSHLADRCTRLGHPASQLQEYHEPHRGYDPIVITHTYHALRRNT